MRLWRISDFADLSGKGALLEPARWHSIEKPLVYLADHPASALLEILVHMEVDREDLPDSYQLLAVELPDGTAFEDTSGLTAGWRSDGDETQRVGNEWMTRGQTALLRVPSAIVPHTWNWLFNPAHPDSRHAQIAEVVRATFDPRLFS